MPEAAAPAAEPVARPATIVVTGETRQAFMEHRMGMKEPPAPPAPVVDAPKAEVKVEAAAPPAEEYHAAQLEEVIEEQAKAQPNPEKKQRLQARFSELTAKIKAAEEKTAAAEKRAQETEAKAATPPPAAAPPVPEVGAAPLRAQFATEEEYLDARVEHIVAKREGERAKAAAEAQAKADGERVVGNYQQRLAATKAEIPDFDARIEANKDLRVPAHVRDAIFESEVGPRIALHFADHPADAARISALGVGAALREIGKIEAMIETAPKAVVKEEVKVAPIAAVSKAPPPIAPIKAGSAAEDSPKLDSAGNFTGTYADFKAARRAGKIK